MPLENNLVNFLETSTLQSNYSNLKKKNYIHVYSNIHNRWNKLMDK